MVEVVFGRLGVYNKYRLQDRLDQYLTPLVIYKTGLKLFPNWVGNIHRPIIGDRVLVVVFEREKLPKRDFQFLYQNLISYLEHSYIDIMWIIEDYRGDLTELALEADMINLRKTHKEDLLRYAREFINDADVCQRFLEKINYNWKLYETHIHKLLSIQLHRPLVLRDVDNNIVVENTIRPEKVLYGILERNEREKLHSKALHNYYKLCKKYSVRWTNQHMEKLLEDVVRLKIRYFIKQNIRIGDMMNNDNSRGLVPIVLKIPAYRVYNLLTIFRETHNPIETFTLYRGSYLTTLGVSKLLDMD